MIKKILITLAVAFMLIPFTSNAAMEKGDTEISFTGSLTSGDGGDSILLSGSYGVMITDAIQVKGTGMMVESNGFLFGLLGGGADYYFSEEVLNIENVIPYAGGSVTFQIGDGPSATFLEGHAGAKNYITESTAVFLEARYLTDTSDFLSTNIFIVMAGISINFGK